MRIDVSVSTWDAAALALTAGNQGAAAAHARLAAAVVTGGGMAGDDATSTDFAAAYDAAAATALDALGELVDGFGTLSRLTRASLDHHRQAEQASTVTCADRVIDTYDPDDPAAAAQNVGVGRPTIPSSRGGDPAALGAHVQWVLDQVQGFCWPNADTGRLRAVGRAWTTAAGEVDELARHARTAAGHLRQQTGPEIPPAIEAIGRLDENRSALGLQLATIGRSCAHYADDVERHRAEILDLVVDLLAGAVVVEGIGLVLGAVTAGLTTVGATAINAARIAAATPRVLAVVEAQSTLARLGATGLDLARGSLVAVAGSLARITSARVIGFAAHATLAGADVGTINPAPLPPAPSSTVPVAVDLCDEEEAGGHVVAKHVGQTDSQMRSRFGPRSNPQRVSTFPDLVTAEQSVAAVLCGRTLATSPCGPPGTASRWCSTGTSVAPSETSSIETARPQPPAGSRWSSSETHHAPEAGSSGPPTLTQLPNKEDECPRTPRFDC